MQLGHDAHCLDGSSKAWQHPKTFVSCSLMSVTTSLLSFPEQDKEPVKFFET